MDDKTRELAFKVARDSYDEVKNYSKGTSERTEQWSAANAAVSNLAELEKIDKDERVADQNATVEREKFESDYEARKYESDAQTERVRDEQETKRFQINKEFMMNLGKAAAGVALTVLGVAVHCADVSAEKELGYDVSDKSGIVDKPTNFMRDLFRK